ncbi:MAG: arylsulfatase [Angelakisella sp.]
MKKLNLLLITADQMRGDCIAALGHPDISTPNLDMMVKNGVAFSSAFSATPTCIPARAALFTGLSQVGHGRVGYQDFVPWDYSTTLPGCLAAGGYHTHCAGKMHVWPPRSLMGFHSVDLHDSFLPHRNTGTAAHNWWGHVDDYGDWLRRELPYEPELGDSGVGCNAWVARPWPLPEYTHPTNWTVSRSLDFLRKRDPTKPFFLWTSFVAPHPPYLPPACYLDRYLSMPLTPPAVGSWAKEIGVEHPDPDCFEGRPSKEELHRMQAGYYGLITQMDDQIGRLMRGLRDEGVLQNTVVLFTADHGEMLGDHHMFRKSQPFAGSVSVPMLLWDPGNHLGLPLGTRCDHITELRDVLPTLLEAAGLPIPESIEGQSLLGLLDGRTQGRTLLHGEHTNMTNALGSMQYIVTHRHKYVWYSQSGQEMLFDRQNDPQELTDLAANPIYAEALAYHRTLLVTALTGRQEGYSDGAQLVVGQTPTHLLDFPKKN